MKTFLTIGNEGQKIISSNFWQTSRAALGLFYISTNAGAVRLLVPARQEHCVPELLHGVSHVILSLGRSPLGSGRPGLEWLAEDGTDTPFSLQICEGNFNFMLAVPPTGGVREVPVSIWVERDGHPHCVAEQRGFVRKVRQLPCLEPLPPGSLDSFSKPAPVAP
jgi:hypothetical protein